MWNIPFQLLGLLWEHGLKARGWNCAKCRCRFRLLDRYRFHGRRISLSYQGALRNDIGRLSRLANVRTFLSLIRFFDGLGLCLDLVLSHRCRRCNLFCKCRSGSRWEGRRFFLLLQFCSLLSVSSTLVLLLPFGLWLDFRRMDLLWFVVYLLQDRHWGFRLLVLHLQRLRWWCLRSEFYLRYGFWRWALRKSLVLINTWQLEGICSAEIFGRRFWVRQGRPVSIQNFVDWGLFWTSHVRTKFRQCWIMSMSLACLRNAGLMLNRRCWLLRALHLLWAKFRHNYTRDLLARMYFSSRFMLSLGLPKLIAIQLTFEWHSCVILDGGADLNRSFGLWMSSAALTMFCSDPCPSL